MKVFNTVAIFYIFYSYVQNVTFTPTALRSTLTDMITPLIYPQASVFTLLITQCNVR